MEYKDKEDINSGRTKKKEKSPDRLPDGEFNYVGGERYSKLEDYPGIKDYPTTESEYGIGEEIKFEKRRRDDDFFSKLKIIREQYKTGKLCEDEVIFRLQDLKDEFEMYEDRFYKEILDLEDECEAKRSSGGIYNSLDDRGFC